MINSSTEIAKVGWQFDNTYARLPKIMISKLSPIPVKSPELVKINYQLAKELGLNFSSISNENLALTFSGNLLPEGSESISQAYAGHQFGNFTMLGDGRAHVIGEHVTKDNKRVDIQFKGSGPTPYSRNADGRAALGPMLREYIISESMHALNIPTTRSLAVVRTGEDVIRETSLLGAILTRVASSHIRVGTFQYLAMQGDVKNLKILVDYTIDRHYPNLKDNKNKALPLIEIVMKRQIELVVNWMRVGFVHGVMNTDNMAISGETIDYGPCAFIDTYNPKTVFSSIDHQGRYAFCNQPSIVNWNLLRFAETLLPLIDDKENKAVLIVNEVMNNFSKIYKDQWLEMMKKKLGIFNQDTSDELLINDLLLLMIKNKSDYTNTFYSLSKNFYNDEEIFKDLNFHQWHIRWTNRLKKNNKPLTNSYDIMLKTNPVVIPRNHKVEEALDFPNDGDLAPTNQLLEVLKNPYIDNSNISDYQSPPAPSEKIYKTFCGT